MACGFLFAGFIIFLYRLNYENPAFKIFWTGQSRLPSYKSFLYLFCRFYHPADIDELGFEFYQIRSAFNHFYRV